MPKPEVAAALCCTGPAAPGLAAVASLLASEDSTDAGTWDDPGTHEVGNGPPFAIL